ncbi:hypothetical protein EUTSA_v10022115mg [Eutrema salsugineum]|uniref:Jacalin-type lectin domain-containing protein n=1 Tax=Eutrema salsugineum TaxID=72664 RepID=V4M600_EUTSA|nr:hypothetical protein EUTSA_v10022115mg [Eutrema salsugineum]
MAAATMSWDDGKHMKVKRVHLTYEDVIKSIEAEYDGDQNPKRHGNPGKKSDGVSLSPDEYITDITGYYKTTGAEDAISALAFKTNKTEYGPYGNKTRNQFSIHAPKDKQIAGFQGISSNVLNSIDVHFAPLPSSSSTPSSALSQANKVDAQGGKGGTSWDDGAHDHVRRVYVGQGDSGVTYVKFEYEKSGNKETREHGKKTLLGAEVFEVDPDDYITSVEVQSDRIFGQDTEVVTCLVFKTSKGKTSPPFGLEGSQKYQLKDKNGGKLVGFHGRVGQLLHALGAYFAPSSSTSSSSGGATQPAGSASGAKKLEAKGGNAGNTWDDGPHDSVKKVYVGQGDSGVSYVKFVYEKDSKEFVLEYPNEYIKSVEINYDNIFGSEAEIITMLRFTTNKRTSPPFGLEGSKSVLLKQDSHKIVGFHGKAGTDIIHQVGVHIKPI